jgi:hypothetical protein
MNQTYFWQSAYGIAATALWPQTRGQGVTVAVVDTGVDLSHPDLAANLWINPSASDSLVNGVNGYNFYDNNTDPSDQYGHGTHVAGIIAAADNGTGIVGVAPEAKIMAVRVGDDQGGIRLSAAIQGIEYAAREGAKVINLSWGGGSDDPALRQAIKDVGAQGALVVVAAGNEGMSESDSPSFPAADGLSNEISVASTNQANQLSFFSSYGPGVDIAAPGESILSDWLAGGYKEEMGTSMAAPMVSGVAALLFSLHPEATPEQVRQALILGAQPLPSLLGKVVAAGLLNAPGALQALESPPPEQPRSGFMAVGSGHFRVFDPTTVKQPTSTDGWPFRVSKTFSWTPLVSSDLEAYRLLLNGQVVAILPPTASRLTVHVLPAGSYHWQIVAEQISGRQVVASFNGQPEPDLLQPGRRAAALPTASTAPILRPARSQRAHSLRVSLNGQAALHRLGLKVYVALFKDNKQLRSAQLGDKPLTLKIGVGNYTLTSSVIVCHGHCLLRGGYSLPPISVADQTLATVTPVCRRISAAPGYECSGSQVSLRNR